jgi:hypothetical protein
MSPLTAKSKCPHATGEDTYGAEAVTEVASDEDGGGREDHLKGGRGKDRCVLPAGQSYSECLRSERSQRGLSWLSVNNLFGAIIFPFFPPPIHHLYHLQKLLFVKYPCR